MSNITAERFHDFSYGHRVVGHENKCRHLHGHNGRVHLVCRAQAGCTSTDDIGRVIDFGEIKSKLCMWLEDNWDHKFLAWENDPLMQGLQAASERSDTISQADDAIFYESIVWLPFNPTAENLAQHLVMVIGPNALIGTGIELVSCKIEETRKCSASFHLGE